MLSIDRLTRVFGDRTVLDEVSFDVAPGRVTGFVGGNGAGKTTTMRVIVGVLSPSGGQVLWHGEPVRTEQRRTFGYMPEERGLYPKMRVVEQLAYFGRLHGLARAAATERAHGLLERLGLDDRGDDVLETLSLGNQQRVQIAAALLHRPTALVLDEPFSGLDPIAVDAMIALLRDEVAHDVPVLFSSHQLDLVERVSDDLVILRDGQVVVSGAVATLLADQDRRIRVRTTGHADPAALGDLPGVTVVESRDHTLLLDPGRRPAAEVLSLVQQRTSLTEFTPLVRPLSDLYREAVG